MNIRHRKRPIITTRKTCNRKPWKPPKPRKPMHIIGTILIGLVVGVIANLLMPVRYPGGFIITILLGIAGAFVATYLGQAVGWYRAGEGAGFIGAVVGAIIILLVYRLIAGRSRTV